VQYLIDKEKAASTLSLMLKTSQDKLTERTQGLLDTVKELEAKVKNLSAAKAAGAIEELFDDALHNGIALPFAVKDMGELDKDAFNRIVDAVSDKIRSKKEFIDVVIVIGAKVSGGVMFAAGAGEQAVAEFGVNCGELVKTAAKRAGGGGGGTPARAQAGGKDPTKLAEALSDVEKILFEKAERQ
ncbi:MAG: hypothetical protein LBB56_06955, partial [Chitinispirillales bacterium]|nr:hypothetical protein [Chitinispirillales bacterium]